MYYLLICGGMATNGRRMVYDPAGAYWISSNMSLRWTT